MKFDDTTVDTLYSSQVRKLFSDEKITDQTQRHCPDILFYQRQHYKNDALCNVAFVPIICWMSVTIKWFLTVFKTIIIMNY